MKTMKRSGSTVSTRLASRCRTTRLYRASAWDVPAFVHAFVQAGSEDQANFKIKAAWDKLKTIEDQTIDGVEFQFNAEPLFEGSEFNSAAKVNLANNREVA